MTGSSTPLKWSDGYANARHAPPPAGCPRRQPHTPANAKAPKAPDKGSPTERLSEVFTETTYQPKAQYWAALKFRDAHPANTAEPPREDLRGCAGCNAGRIRWFI